MFSSTRSALPSARRLASCDRFSWRPAPFGLRTSGRAAATWTRAGRNKAERMTKSNPTAREVRPGQRIAKVMARAGVCSRREAEAWIVEGRVSVNGEVLKSPAFNVSETDSVQVDGKPLAAAERTRLFLFHKPRGLVTTARDPEGRNTVFAALPPDLPRWSRSAGSTSTPKDCCSSPTTAGWRACSSFRRPAGCAAIASARTEPSIRRRSIS